MSIISQLKKKKKRMLWPLVGETSLLGLEGENGNREIVMGVKDNGSRVWDQSHGGSGDGEIDPGSKTNRTC